MGWPKRIGILLLPVLLQGCFALTGPVDFESLRPSEITIDKGINILAVTSRFDLDSNSLVRTEYQDVPQAFRIDSLLSATLISGCSDQLANSPRIALWNPVIVRTFLDNRGKSRPIPWSIIRQVAGEPPCDAVLVLESGAVSDTLKSGLYDGWFRYYSYEIKQKTNWRLYSLVDFKTQDFTFQDTVTFNLDSPDQLQEDGLAVSLIVDAAYVTGQKCAVRFAPWWDSVKRDFFIAGSPAFLRSAQHLAANNTGKAAELLRPLTESRSKPTAAKACYNMAVVCEMANQPDAALEWLSRSLGLGMKTGLVEPYKGILKARKTEIKRLDEQMGKQ